jgi:hypothetical protein
MGLAASLTELAKVDVVGPQLVLIPPNPAGKVLPEMMHHKYDPEDARPPVAE